MSVTAPATADPVEPPVAAESAGARRRPWRADALFAVVALAFAVYVTQTLWSDPYGHVLRDNVGDQAFFEWLLGYGVQVVQGANPFYSTMMNAPTGVNLAANTSITVYIVLFSPLTHLLGPQVTFATILTLNLAGSAVAWYLFYLRFVTRHRVAAGVAALFCGFAPGFISHANGHLNWTAGWIAPLSIWLAFKLREPGRLRWLRNGAILGVAVAVCFSIAAEGLFFTAMAIFVFLVTWSLSRATRAEARAALPNVLRGLGVAAVVAGALLAYPLWMHFAGPGSFSGTGFDQNFFLEDAAAYLSYSGRSLAAWAGLDGSHLASNATEETTFFGLPLMVLVVASLILLWRHADAGRRATLRALTVVGVVFMLLSFGPRLQVLENETKIPMPYAALQHLPLFDAALPARYGLVVAGVIGLVLAFTADRLFSGAKDPALVHTAFAAAFAVALVPLIPTPLLGQQRSAEPAFIADGVWQRYVPDGGVLTTLPFALTGSADGQRWQAYTMARGGPQFRIPAGYFLGPGPRGHAGPGQIGASWRNTNWLFAKAAKYGDVGQISGYDRRQARVDLEYWGIDAVFLPVDGTAADGVRYRSALELVATELLGPPERVSDVLLWQVRPGVDRVTPGG